MVEKGGPRSSHLLLRPSAPEMNDMKCCYCGHEGNMLLSDVTPANIWLTQGKGTNQLLSGNTGRYGEIFMESVK